MAEAKRDQNSVPTLLGVSSVDGVTPVVLWADPTTHRLLVDLSGGGSGTVTDVSVVTANGISGSVATSTTTPAITLTLGAITPTSVSATSFLLATPSTDTIAGVFRRNWVGQTSNILEIQTEANAFLAGFNKTGALITSSVIGNTAVDLSVTTPAVTSATPAVDGIAKNVLITGGQTTVTTPADVLYGGSISIEGGHLEPSDSTNHGGDFYLDGGDVSIVDITDYTGSVGGGVLEMTAGRIIESANTLDSRGGGLTLGAGFIYNSTEITAGNVYLASGMATTATETGEGAVLQLTGGDSTTGTTTGGSILFERGAGTDVIGSYKFKGPSLYGILDFESIATADKTFTFPNATGTVVLNNNTATITNKRNQSRTASSTTSSNLSPDLSTANVYFRTTQTATLTIDAPTGTPVIGEVITLYVDSAGAQTLTINGTYKAFGAAFPATTTAGKTFMMTAMYNGTDWKTTWANAV